MPYKDTLSSSEQNRTTIVLTYDGSYFNLNEQQNLEKCNQ